MYVPINRSSTVVTTQNGQSVLSQVATPRGGGLSAIKTANGAITGSIGYVQPLNITPPTAGVGSNAAIVTPTGTAAAIAAGPNGNSGTPSGNNTFGITTSPTTGVAGAITLAALPTAPNVSPTQGGQNGTVGNPGSGYGTSAPGTTTGGSTTTVTGQTPSQTGNVANAGNGFGLGTSPSTRSGGNAARVTPSSASNVTAAGTISAALVAALSGGLGLPTQPVAGTSGATQTAPLPGAINVSTPTVPQGPPLQISPPLVSEPPVGTGSSTAQPIAVGSRLLKPIVDPLVSEQKPGDVKPGSSSSAIGKAAGALSGLGAPNAGVPLSLGLCKCR